MIHNSKVQTNHISLSSSNDVKDICKPLFNAFGLNFFRYLKINSNGTRSTLSSNAYWTEHFYEHKFYKVAWFDNKNFDQFTSGNVFWDTKAVKEDNIVGVHSRDKFDMHHGITIIEKNENYTVFYDFTTTKNNLVINELFDSKISLLKHFIFFFKEKAFNLIRQADNNNFLLPDLRLVGTGESNANGSTLTTQLENSFLQQTSVNNYYLGDSKTRLHLTKRQVECVKKLYSGLTIDNIAQELFLAKRTVETHIQNAKKLLNCRKRDDLIKKALLLGIIQQD